MGLGRDTVAGRRKPGLQGPVSALETDGQCLGVLTRAVTWSDSVPSCMEQGQAGARSGQREAGRPEAVEGFQARRWGWNQGWQGGWREEIGLDLLGRWRLRRWAKKREESRNESLVSSLSKEVIGRRQQLGMKVTPSISTAKSELL